MKSGPIHLMKNHATLPSLSNGGKVRLGMKAEFLLFLEPNMPENRSTPAFDSSASVLQMLKHGSSNTFQENAFLHTLERSFIFHVSASDLQLQ